MHELAEWKDRDDDLVGGSVFSPAEEVQEARKEGSIEIKITSK